MGRALRTDVGGYIYHVLNRANAGIRIFNNDKEYQFFEQVLSEAKEKFNMRVLAYSIMPNHWHFVVYPRKDGDLSSFMNWLTLTHTQRWHVRKKTTGQGHLYQGRYKSFLCQDDNHFIALARYVERNALRANLIEKAEKWKWGSAYRRIYGTSTQKELLSPWPMNKPKNYFEWLNQPQSEDEENAIKESIREVTLMDVVFGMKGLLRNLILKQQLEVGGGKKKVPDTFKHL